MKASGDLPKVVACSRQAELQHLTHACPDFAAITIAVARLHQKPFLVVSYSQADKFLTKYCDSLLLQLPVVHPRCIDLRLSQTAQVSLFSAVKPYEKVAVEI